MALQNQISMRDFLPQPTSILAEKTEMCSSSSCSSSSCSSSSSWEKCKGRRNQSSDSSISTSSSSSECYERGLVVVESPPQMNPPSQKKKKDKREIRRECKERVCSCTTGAVADCAALCCCPLAVFHLLALALVKVPTTCVRKIAKYAAQKKKTQQPLKPRLKYECDESARHFTPPWSRRESPASSKHMDISRIDSERMWNDLYEGGHLGFGGRHFASRLSSESRPSNFSHLLSVNGNNKAE